MGAAPRGTPVCTADLQSPQKLAEQSAKGCDSSQEGEGKSYLALGARAKVLCEEPEAGETSNGGKWGGGMNWETGIDIYILKCIK